MCVGIYELHILPELHYHDYNEIQGRDYKYSGQKCLE